MPTESAMDASHSRMQLGSGHTGGGADVGGGAGLSSAGGPAGTAPGTPTRSSIISGATSLTFSSAALSPAGELKATREIKDRVEELERVISETHQRETESLQAYSSRLDQELRDKDNEIKATRVEFDRLRAALDAERRSSAPRIAELEARLSDADRKLEASSGVVANMRTSINDLINERERMRENTNLQLERVRSDERRRYETEVIPAIRTALEEDKRGLARDFTGRIEALEKQLAHLEQRAELADRRASAAEDARRRMAAEAARVPELSSKLAALMTRDRENVDSLNALHRDNRSFVQELRTRAERIRALEQDLERLRLRAERAEREVSRTQDWSPVDTHYMSRVRDVHQLVDELERTRMIFTKTLQDREEQLRRALAMIEDQQRLLTVFQARVGSPQRKDSDTSEHTRRAVGYTATEPFRNY